MTQFLYVEDDPLSRDVFIILFTRAMGYDRDTITLFEDSEAFMERLRVLPQKPEIIFLDVHMKPLDGFQMLELVRADPVYDDVRVIAMTAGVMATDIDQLKRAGFNGLVGKPIRKNIFPDLLRRIQKGEPVWFTT